MERTVSIIALLCFAIMMAAFLGYTGRDDSHITYFVADALADGRGVVNLNGEPIEQSSSLSFSTLLAGLVWLTGLPAAMLGPFVSFSIFLLTVIAVGLGLAQRPWGAASAVALLAAPSLYWALSGMENALYVAAIFGLIFAVSHARAFLVACLAGVLTLTRPEAPFVILSAFGLLFLYERRLWPGALAAAMGIAGGFCVRFALGLGLFPNTVAAKMSHESIVEQIGMGGAYIAVTVGQLPWTGLCFLLCIALLPVIRCKRSLRADPLIPILTAFGLALFLFPFAAGGDWMETGRLVSAGYPALVLVALLSVRPSLRLAGVAAFAAAIFADFTMLAKRPYSGSPLWAAEHYEALNFDPISTERFNRYHARDISFIDSAIPAVKAALAENGDKPLTLASIQAGMIPYYLVGHFADRIVFVDLLGLTTNHVHGCREARETKSWRDPYQDLASLEACMGVSIDMIFEIERYGRLQKVEAFGCDIVFVDEPTIADVPWRQDLVEQQFLADCRDRG